MQSPKNPKQRTSTDLQQAGGIEIGPQELMIAAGPLHSIYIAQQVGGLHQKLQVTHAENAKLKEKLKTFKKENASMSRKIGELEKNNRQQIETIRSLEQAQEKLQKELETVKDAKDKLRVKVEKENAKFNMENKILTEKLDALTKAFEVVENENKDLQRSLAELTNDNTFLKKKVDSIQKENEKLQNEMGELNEKHNKILEKLDRKETRLALGQVAWILEAEIWKNVLPNVGMGTTRILNSMERWLKKNRGEKEGVDAQKRWEELRSKLNWDEDDHKPALKVLKALRIEDAHPTVVDLEEAGKQLKEGDYIAEPDKESCQQIIGMIKTTKTLNEMKQ